MSAGSCKIEITPSCASQKSSKLAAQLKFTVIKRAAMLVTAIIAFCLKQHIKQPLQPGKEPETRDKGEQVAHMRQQEKKPLRM